MLIAGPHVGAELAPAVTQTRENLPRACTYPVIGVAHTPACAGMDHKSPSATEVPVVGTRCPPSWLSRDVEQLRNRSHWRLNRLRKIKDRVGSEDG